MKASKLLIGVFSATIALNIIYAAASKDNSEDMRGYLKSGFSCYSEEINLKSFGYEATKENQEMVRDMVFGILEDPDMFCINYSSYALKMTQGENDELMIDSLVNIKYTTSPEETELYKEEFDAKVSQIINSTITPDMTDVEKALRLHDYLVLNTSYDTADSIPDLNGGYSAYDIIVKNNGVCQGYALAYQHLLSKVGIESKVVKSYEMNHGWNLVKIDDKWYHVDVTWDDPVPDTPGRVNHSYFLLSDEAMSSSSKTRTKPHHDWEDIGITADDTTYDNMFWNQVQTEIFVLDDKWYFVDSTGGYTTYYRDEDRTEVYVSLYENPWYVWGTQYTSQDYWTGKYTSLLISGDTVYFNTPTQLYCMKLDGSMKSGLMYIDPNTNDGFCYGLVYQNDAIYGVIKQAPNETGHLVKLKEIHFDSYSYIESMLKKIEEMGEGESASFNLSAEKMLPSRALELIMEKDVQLNIECNDYVWSINGKNVNAVQESDIDLSVNTNLEKIPSELFSGLSEDQAYFEIDLSENNPLSFTADVSCTLSNDFAGKNAEIFRFDSDSSKIIKVDSALVDENGKITIPVSNASEYAVIIGGVNASMGGSQISTESSNNISKVAGDVDGSFDTDLTDLTFLSQYLLDEITLSADAIERADVTGDGETDIADLALMKQYVMGKIATFPNKKK